MTEYWKSNARKYCDMCKCWLNDNPASITFHDNGKRHQEAVAKRLAEIQKKTRSNDKADKKAAKSYDRIEKAALEAYSKDKELNPDISLKVQAFNDYLVASDSSSTAGASAEEAPTPTVPKILHRDEKKLKRDAETLEELSKPPPIYTSARSGTGWKPIESSSSSSSSSSNKIDLELPTKNNKSLLDHVHHHSSSMSNKKSKYDFEEKTLQSSSSAGGGLFSSSTSSPFIKPEQPWSGSSGSGGGETVVGFKKRRFGGVARKRDGEQGEED